MKNVDSSDRFDVQQHTIAIVGGFPVVVRDKVTIFADGKFERERVVLLPGELIEVNGDRPILAFVPGPYFLLQDDWYGICHVVFSFTHRTLQQVRVGEPKSIQFLYKKRI